METVPPLWRAPNQPDRLAELTAKTSDANKEAPLRRDVRSLGILLGRVLVEQAGPELFDTVERLRRLLIQNREKGFPPSSDNPEALLQEGKSAVALLDVSTAYRVTKAFAAYFELTNLADESSQTAAAGCGSAHRRAFAAGIFSRHAVAHEKRGRQAGTGTGRTRRD
jgi:phosphoenolpyruvate carboxylase